MEASGMLNLNFGIANAVAGIIRCDMIAESIISAAAQLGLLRCPIVVRLQGTNAEEGQRMASPSLPDPESKKEIVNFFV
jgi:succinyl-CoA synthetase beta subunit